MTLNVVRENILTPLMINMNEGICCQNNEMVLYLPKLNQILEEALEIKENIYSIVVSGDCLIEQETIRTDLINEIRITRQRSNECQNNILRMIKKLQHTNTMSIISALLNLKGIYEDVNNLLSEFIDNVLLFNDPALEALANVIDNGNNEVVSWKEHKKKTG